MQELHAAGLRNMILCSGTLSPMESFAQELGMHVCYYQNEQIDRTCRPFDIRLENPHVISPQQISVCVIGRGPSGKTLNSSFQMRQSDDYKTELGATIGNSFVL